MSLASGKRHLLGAVFPVLQVLRAHGTIITRLCVVVEVHQVFILDPDGRRPLHPMPCERLAGLSKWTLRMIGYCISKFLFQRCLALTLEEQVKLVAGLKQSGVDGIEAGIVKQTGLGEGLEVRRGDAVEAIVVAVIPCAVTLWIPARNGAGPEHQPLGFGLVERDFRSPNIAGVRFVFHERYGLLLRPSDEIFRARVADDLALFCSPTARPDQMERAIWSLSQAGITHDLVSAHLWFEKGPVTVECLPLVTIRAEGQMQARIEIACGLYAGGEVSLGRAARIAGVPYIAFMHELAKRDICLNYTMADLEHDFDMAEKLARQAVAA